MKNEQRTTYLYSEFYSWEMAEKKEYDKRYENIPFEKERYLGYARKCVQNILDNYNQILNSSTRLTPDEIMGRVTHQMGEYGPKAHFVFYEALTVCECQEILKEQLGDNYPTQWMRDFFNKLSYPCVEREMSIDLVTRAFAHAISLRNNIWYVKVFGGSNRFVSTMPSWLADENYIRMTYNNIVNILEHENVYITDDDGFLQGNFIKQNLEINGDLLAFAEKLWLEVVELLDAARDLPLGYERTKMLASIRTLIFSL